MAFRDTIRDYSRAVDQRLADAHELMEPPTRDAKRSDVGYRHYRGAMYLAGYAIECLLKAYLIDHMNAPTLLQAMGRLDARRKSQKLKPAKQITRTAAGHEITYILSLTNLETFAGYDQKLWGRLGKWKSSWRYESEIIQPDTAVEFLEDVEAGVNWLKAKLGG